MLPRILNDSHHKLNCRTAMMIHKIKQLQTQTRLQQFHICTKMCQTNTKRIMVTRKTQQNRKPKQCTKRFRENHL